MTSKATIAALPVALTVFFAAAGATSAQDTGAHHRGHARAAAHADAGGFAFRRGMLRFEQFLEDYDSDGDGRVTQEEINAARAARLAAFDSDGDGALSLPEYEALWLDAMRERMVDRFQSHDDDGSGLITLEEFTDEFARIVTRRDRDGDGALSADDLRRSTRDGGRPGRDPHRDE